MCHAAKPKYSKVAGNSNCAEAGLADFSGTADGCVKAAESLGYDFTAARKGKHKVPVIHEPDNKSYARTCVVCLNMIYQGRPDFLFWDKAKGPTSCNQDGKQTKFHICQRKATTTPKPNVNVKP